MNTAACTTVSQSCLSSEHSVDVDSLSWCRGNPVLRSTASEGGEEFDYRSEPVVTAFRQMTFENKKQQRVIDVPVAATPISLANGHVVIASEDGFLRCFDDKLSETKWALRVNARLYASPTYDRVLQLLISVSTRGHVLAVSTEGHILWTTNVGHCAYNSPAICNESKTVYVSTFDHLLFALDVETGETKWQAVLPEPWGNAVGAAAGFRDPYAGPSLDFRGGCVQASAEHLTRFNQEGTVVWQRDLRHTVRTTVAVSNPYRRGLAGSTNGRIQLFDIETGHSLADFALRGRLMNSPAIRGHLACIGTAAGEVLCVDVENGSELWRTNVHGGLDHGSVTWTPTGDFVMVLSNGNAICLDRRSGAFIWETSQVLELPLHRREIHQTPVVTDGGIMLASSYYGFVYLFKFRRKA